VDIAVERGAGLYILVRTSNPGAGTFQDRESSGKRLYEVVAESVEALSVETAGEESFGPIGAVVGATYPDELRALRGRMPHVPLLIPGYGSQGGTASDVAAAFQSDGMGAVVNNSRGILFAGDREPYRSQFAPDQWQAAVEKATRAMIADLAE